MALDGMFLNSIVYELNNSILNGKIDKVNQPEKDEIVLTIRQGRKNTKLLISASANYPRIHLTNLNKTNPIKAPMFCMVLRKYLTNSRILEINQINSDRLLVINLESRDELGFDSIYSLIIEIMGRHSNITLVRGRDGIIMDSIKHVTPDMNSYRITLPGIKYVYPPKSNKLSPLQFNIDEAKKQILENNIELNENMFMKLFTGISKTLSKEIAFNLKSNNISMDLNCIDNILDFSKNIFDKFSSKDFHYFAYKKNNSLKDFYCIALKSMQDYDKLSYESPSKLLENFYYTKDKLDRLKAKSSDLHKIVTNNINRCIKKDSILNSTLKECEDKEKYQLYGELLTANIYAIEKGMKEIEVLNYYSDNSENICVKLDENKTPSQNIQIYYKKYNKLKKSEESAHEQLNQNADELDYLYSVLTNIENASNYDEINEIKNELIETGYIKFKKSHKNNKSKASKPMHFVSSDGFDMYVGKNNIQNDFLTLKFANKHDIWMHTKEIPGSHVIIRNSGEIPYSTLLEGANLAAYYSKGQNSSKVPVDYTEVKNVKKPNGAKPGMVIYSTNQTLYITPEEPDISNQGN
ncbi:NFACT RNA binding domain-containing protein [Clostridium sp. MB40-C1]|uniref:Rqc2 family fibronectin-binding protein n=1 Tax=Clostridium sp. MB40-C1 TaxID=3070996 RepID=UPI0027E1C816|nr:NFACT RNA binding domain-containing protein [Clostridium sp. MB40-C1]WMJ81383.1 NFACT RNA binding domain-containing protein [Clostridium sp. MB40-C1]